MSVNHIRLKEKEHYFILAKNVPDLLEKLSKEGSALCDDEEFVKVCLKTNYNAISFASERLRSKKRIIYPIIERDISLYKEAGESLLRSKSFARFMSRLNYSSSYFKNYFDMDWVGDRRIMGKLINVSGYYFSILSPQLKADKKWLLKLVGATNGFVFKFFENSLKNDKEFVLEAIKNRAPYRDIGKSLFSDEDVLREALKNESCFGRASENLRSNKEVAKWVLECDGNSYSHLSEDLKRSKEMLLLAINSCNKKAQRIRFLPVIPKELKTKEVAFLCIEFGEECLENFKHLKDDKEFVLKVVSKEGSSIRYASERLRNDYLVVFAAVSSDGSAIAKVGSKFRENYFFCYKALRNYPWVYSDLSEKIKDDPVLAKMVIKEDATLIRNSSERIKNDLSIVRLGIRNNIFKNTGELAQKSIYYARQRLGITSVNEISAITDEKCILWLFDNKNEKECSDFLKSINYENLGVLK